MNTPAQEQHQTSGGEGLTEEHSMKNVATCKQNHNVHSSRTSSTRAPLVALARLSRRSLGKSDKKPDDLPLVPT